MTHSQRPLPTRNSLVVAQLAALDGGEVHAASQSVLLSAAKNPGLVFTQSKPSELAARRSILSSRASRGICCFFALALSAIFLSATPKPPSRPRILGIAAVRISSTNIAGARDFYGRTLNPFGPCVWCEEVPRSSLAMALNGSQLLFVSIAPDPAPSNLLAEIALSTDDVKAMQSYLRANDVAFSVPKDDEAPLQITDPEGRHISIRRRFQASPMSPLNNTDLHLIHAGFIVHDRAATEHFYKDILGFRPYWHGGMKEDQTDWVSMQVPDGTDWLEFMVNVSPDADQRVRGIMNHIAIGVTDIHETEKRLRAAGAPVDEEPKIGRDGKWQLNLYDPDQTRVEFMEFTPVQKPCCSNFTGPHPHP